MAKKSEKTSCLEIQRKFETFKYLVLDDTTCVLEVSYSGVYVHKDGPLNQDVVKSLSGRRWNTDKVLCQKFKGSSSGGEYKFFLKLVPTNFFESREKLDALLSEEWRFDEPSDNLLPSIETVERISFKEALKLFRVKLSCNMEYFLENRTQLGTDLGRALDGEFDVKQVKDELFLKLVFNIFGPEEDDEDGQVSFKNFRQLHYDGNDMYGTAQRGDCYFVFHYLTS